MKMNFIFIIRDQRIAKNAKIAEIAEIDLVSRPSINLAILAVFGDPGYLA
jgi:hypothetical protein